MFYPNQNPAYQTGLYYGGYTMGARPQPKNTQPVTAELAKMLGQSNDELDIRISNTDKVRNWCTHKEPGTGRIALVENNDGTVTCRVCGETFHLVEDPEKDIQELTDRMVDALQTMKTIYMDIPEEFLKNYSQTLSMIKKAPDLMKRATKNFSLYENFSGNAFSANAGVNPYQATVGLLSGFNPFGIGYQQPMMGFGYPQQPAQQPIPPQQFAQQQWANPPMAAAPMMPQQQPVAPQPAQVDPWGSVMSPAYPPAMTQLNGAPMAPGYNPLMATGTMPGQMVAPAPTAAPVQQAPAATEPTQSKQMTV